MYFVLNFAEHTQGGEPNPLRDERVRMVLLQALDLDGIRRSVMRGQSRVTGALVAPAIPGYAPELDARPLYDPEAAKRLLAQAGYPGGLTLQLVCSTDSLVAEDAICTAASAMWARVGVRTQPSIAPRVLITLRRVAGQFDITLSGWANEPAIDALSILTQVLRSRTGLAGIFNWGGWGQPDMDRLIDAANNELDRDKRLAMMTEALGIAKVRTLFLPVHQQPMAWAMRDNVEQVVQLPDNKARHWLTRMRE